MKFISVFLILTSCYRAFAQSDSDELSKFKFQISAPQIGAIGDGRNSWVGLGASATASWEFHTITAFYNGCEYNSALTYSRDKYSIFSTKSYGAVYGLGYYSKYFSASFGLGVCYVEAHDYSYHSNPGNTSGTASALYAVMVDEVHKGYYCPLLFQMGVHGKALGFNLQFIEIPSQSYNDWRLMAGFSIGLHR